MFQIASSASNKPALRPIRGSGLGGVVDNIAEEDPYIGESDTMGLGEHADNPRRLPAIKTTQSRFKICPQLNRIGVILPFIVDRWISGSEM